jgi:hypothetical protein
MGRKAASPPTDRSVAETRRRRGDSSQIRTRVAQPRLGVAGAPKVRHRGRRPTKQSHLATIEANETCAPEVIDDFSRPIPVLERELDAIEIYLGPLLDEMLQRSE